MTVEPYASAKRVFWVVDNGSSHRGQASVDRLEGAWPNLRLIHLPIHASWLNQIEIVFSIIQRKVVTPNDFTNLEQISDRLAAFEDRYNATAEPFDWRFTRDDLARMLRTHRQPRPRRSATTVRCLIYSSSEIHADGSPRYNPQAQSSASSGLPPITPVGRNDSS